MVLSNIDEINAYKNQDGSWTIEGHGDQKSFTMPYSNVSVNLQGSIGNPLEIEFIIRGMVDNVK